MPEKMLVHVGKGQRKKEHRIATLSNSGGLVMEKKTRKREGKKHRSTVA